MIPTYKTCSNIMNAFTGWLQQQSCSDVHGSCWSTPQPTTLSPTPAQKLLHDDADGANRDRRWPWTSQNLRRHLGRSVKIRRILKTEGSQTQPAGPAAHIWQDTRKDPQQHSPASGCEAPEFSSATCQKFQTAHVIIYSSQHVCLRVHSWVFSHLA